MIFSGVTTGSTANVTEVFFLISQWIDDDGIFDEELGIACSASAHLEPPSIGWLGYLVIESLHPHETSFGRERIEKSLEKPYRIALPKTSLVLHPSYTAHETEIGEG